MSLVNAKRVWFAWKWTWSQRTFSYDWFRKKTPFDTGARGNSEMACYTFNKKDARWITFRVVALKWTWYFKHDEPASYCKLVFIFVSVCYNWPSSLFSSNEAVKVSSLSFISFISLRMFLSISLFICCNLSLMFSEDKYLLLLKLSYTFLVPKIE